MLLICCGYPNDNEQGAYPVDAGRKLNVHKTFRRRPGRLLNVSCTFNLRPVSTWYVIIFFICSDLYNCLTSLCTVAIRSEGEKEKRKFLTASSLFHVSMYFFYGHPRNFNFKLKYQQYSPFFQTIFPFLMTML